MGRFLTKNMFLPASRFRRARRAGMRPVYRHYLEGLEFRRQSRDWDDERKGEWVLKELRRSVRAAARHTDYYRELFFDAGFDPESEFGFGDFAKLPVLEREAIPREGERLISQNVPAAERVRNSTGGSTGVPTQTWMGPEERGWSESGLEFALAKVGVPPGSRIAYFWGHHLDPKLGDTFAERLRAWALNVRFFDCFRLSPEIFHRYHLEFEKFSPDCIVAYASALGQFAEYLREKKIRPRNCPRTCFITGAEKLYTVHREAIDEVFGKPVHERYGGRDFGPVAIQTDPQKKLDFEIDWTWALVEPETDDKNAPILVTKLHGDAMPMIRYRVGDVGRFTAGHRPGHPAFYIHEVTGRELDGIRLLNGKWIHGIELPHLLKDFPVREFTFVQDEDYSVELQIVPGKEFGETNARKITDIITANLQGLPLKIRLVERTERTIANKWRPVITKVKI